jgi:DNA-directed RNA polymerase sigma subunit (sigma70/sigma32)
LEEEESKLEKALSPLSDIERKIIEKRFLIDGDFRDYMI